MTPSQFQQKDNEEENGMRRDGSEGVKQRHLGSGISRTRNRMAGRTQEGVKGSTVWGVHLRFSFFPAEEYKQPVWDTSLSLKCFQNTWGEISRKYAAI